MDPAALSGGPVAIDYHYFLKILFPEVTVIEYADIDDNIGAANDADYVREFVLMQIFPPGKLLGGYSRGNVSEIIDQLQDTSR